MNTPDSVLDALKALNDLGVAYLIVGSLSSNIYGTPRSTADADIVIQTGDQIDRIREVLKPRFRAEPQIGFETIGMTTKHLFYERDSAFKLELFVLSNDAFDQARFARRIHIESDGVTLSVPTAEDVVIQKLRWGRLKDLADAADVMQLQHKTLDWPYIRQWCEWHGSVDRLEVARAEAGLSEA